MSDLGSLIGGFGLFLMGIAAIWWVTMQDDARKAAEKERKARKD